MSPEEGRALRGADARRDIDLNVCCGGKKCITTCAKMDETNCIHKVENRWIKLKL